MIIRFKKWHLFLIGAIVCAAIIITSIYPQVKAAESPLAGDSGTVKFSIIMYHHLTVSAKSTGAYTLLVKQFESDLKYLKDNGYESISMAQLIDFGYGKGELPEKPVMLTFDDGQESFLLYAFPLLKEYGMKAVVSIVGKYADEATERQDHNPAYAYLDWAGIKTLSDSGIVEIENHTYNLHQSTNKAKGCSIMKGESEEHYSQRLKEDIGVLQDRIETETGKRPSTFAYPFGYISKEARPILKEIGFSALLCCRSLPVEAKSDPEDTEWLYRLGRYNRPNGITSKQFFEKALSN